MPGSTPATSQLDWLISTTAKAAWPAACSSGHGMVRDRPRQRLAVKPAGSISPPLCFELFQSTGDPGGAEVAGMTIPEHGHIRIPVQTAPMGGVQIDGIESLPQPHRRSRLSCIRGALVKKTGRGDIARREQPIATRQKPSTAIVISVVALIWSMANTYFTFFWHPQDLRVYFRFPAPAAQVGTNTLNVNYIMSNMGNQAVLIEDVGIYELWINSEHSTIRGAELHFCEDTIVISPESLAPGSRATLSTMKGVLVSLYRAHPVDTQPYQI